MQNEKNTFTAEHAAEIEAARRANKDKKIEARLKVLALRADGKSLSDITEITGYHRSHVSGLIRQYFEEGITSITQKHYGGNHRNMSEAEEAAFLEAYIQRRQSRDTCLMCGKLLQLTRKRWGTQLGTHRYTVYCIGITGEKSCRGANIRIRPAKRSLKPQKN